MKVLLINGGPHREGCTHRALTEVAGALHESGIETEFSIWGISRYAVAPAAAAACARSLAAASLMMT